MKRDYSDEITQRWVNDSLGPEPVVEKKEKKEKKERVAGQKNTRTTTS